MSSTGPSCVPPVLVTAAGRIAAADRYLRRVFDEEGQRPVVGAKQGGSYSGGENGGIIVEGHLMPAMLHVRYTQVLARAHNAGTYRHANCAKLTNRQDCPAIGTAFFSRLLPSITVPDAKHSQCRGQSNIIA